MISYNKSGPTQNHNPKMDHYKVTSCPRWMTRFWLCSQFQRVTHSAFVLICQPSDRRAHNCQEVCLYLQWASFCHHFCQVQSKLQRQPVHTIHSICPSRAPASFLFIFIVNPLQLLSNNKSKASCMFAKTWPEVCVCGLVGFRVSVH